MKKLTHLYIAACLALTLGLMLSCAKKDGGSSSSDDTSSTTTTTTDTTAPVIAEVTAVITPTNDTTPNYTFSSTVAGTITYGGSCSSNTTSAISENNTITLNTLSEGTYSDCTIVVTDATGNVSNTLVITSFILDLTAPTLAEVTAVTTLTNDTTPNYTFSSDEVGTITYGGSCTSSTTSASSGNNAISFSTLSDGTYSDCTIKVTDSLAYESSSLSVSSFTIDSTAPVIAQVTAVPSPTNDTTLSYTFSSTEAGTISYGGSCSSDNTSAMADNNTITFSTLSSGSYSNCEITVADNATNQSNTLSVNSFTIDATSPSVSSVSSTTSNGAYKLNDNITVTVTFNETVFVDNSSGNPRIELETGSTDRYANYTSGNSSTVLSFLYTVQSGDDSGDLDYKATDSFSANSGTIRDNMTNNATLTLASPGATNSLGANKAIVIDTALPRVVNVSSTNSDGSYILNDNITVLVTFSEIVLIDNSTGTPRIQLETGTNDRYANFSSGNSSTVISFIYTVQSDDNSSDLDYKATDSLSLNSGTIRDNASNDATLTLPSPSFSGSLGENKSIIIDGIIPTVSSTSPSDNESTVKFDTSITVIFSETMDNSTFISNTDNTSCNGTFQVSSDNFSTCVQMGAAPSITNYSQTFSVTPKDNLTSGETYKILISTGVKDSKGNSIASQYTQSTGFNTIYMLPDTGQTDNYTNTFGEDSDYNINPMLLTNNGDNTVTDNNTNLIWENRTYNSYTWSDAVTYCSDLTFAGKNDWRLPEAKELQTIINYDQEEPALDTSIFSNFGGSNVWSSTSKSATKAWYVNFGYGILYSSGTKSSTSLMTACVRGNSNTPSFSDNDNGTITELKTGFVWQKEDDNTLRNWETSLAYCENLSLGGKNDWRLPNIKELSFLLHSTNTNPAIDSSFFPNTNIDNKYYTSTHDKEHNWNAWYVDFSTAHANKQTKTGSLYTRCVRSD